MTNQRDCHAPSSPNGGADVDTTSTGIAEACHCGAAGNGVFALTTATWQCPADSHPLRPGGGTRGCIDRRYYVYVNGQPTVHNVVHRRFQRLEPRVLNTSNAHTPNRSPPGTIGRAWFISRTNVEDDRAGEADEIVVACATSMEGLIRDRDLAHDWYGEQQ